MNNLNELVSHGIDKVTAEKMLCDYQRRIGSVNGDYKIIDISYNYEIRGKIVTLKCMSCGNVITRTMINGRNKWSELIKTCNECKKKRKTIISENVEKEKRKQLLNEIGKRYGDYEVCAVEFGNPDKLILKCIVCGAEKRVSYICVKNEKWKDNICHKHNIQQIKYDESYIGKKYGRLEVIGVREGQKRKFQCQCDCGNVIFARPIDLEKGNVKSCGCIQREISENSVSYDRLYHVWNGMKSRCYYENLESYRNYGGRGIAICDEWLNSYQSFRDWAYENGYDENAPRGECTIDRIDVNGNYEPNNCRWISNLEQQRNKRPSSEWKKRTKKRTSFLVYNGEKISKYELCKQHGISQETFNYRIKEKKMSIEDALKTPKMTSGRPKKEPVIYQQTQDT